jgi:guanylate kinase
MSLLRSQCLLMVVSAPSGAGKTTLCQELLAHDPQVSRVVTCTTRPPRPGEQGGVDYYFLAAAEFARGVTQGRFLEHAVVHGHCYGTPKADVLERLGTGQDVLLNIDVQGAASIRDAAGRDGQLKQALFTVFIVPPSLAELEARLRKRAQDSEEVIQRRLAAARGELAHWRDFDYVVISDTVPNGLRQLQALVAAERMRQFRVQLPEL